MSADEPTRLRALLERTAARVLTVAEERDAATKRAERAERERDDLAATLATRDAEHALAMARVRELESIIAGRDTPPTDAEIAAHWRAGGTWVVEGVIVLRSAEAARSHRDQTSWAAVPWVPMRDGRPCAWPTAEVSRG